MSKNNIKILLCNKENNFILNEQIVNKEMTISFIKTKDNGDNISIKNREKMKKSNITNKIFLENNYKNILIILLIQILIILVNSQEVDISSKYEMTILMGGEGTIELFNSYYFKIIPSYINVDDRDVEVNGSYLYNLKADELHVIKVRWNTEITNCSHMFSGLTKLKKVSMLSFDFSKVVDMSNMFANCGNIFSIQFNNPDTSKVTDMRQMFYNCQKLTDLDLSDFSTILVTNMNSMFYNCSSLASLNLSNFNTPLVTNMDYMFYQCTNLKILDVSNFNTENVTTMYQMFYACKNLLTLDLSNFKTPLLISNLNYMFYNCSKLNFLDISNFDTSNITRMDYMFSNCFALLELNLSNFNTELVVNMTSMFLECKNLKSLDILNFNTENCTDMSYMFCNCTSLISLNLSHFNTQKVQSMIQMFIGCNNLQSLDISNFNFQLITHSFTFFQNLYNLKYLNLQNVDTKNIQSMKNTFYNLQSLTSLDLSSFNTGQVKDMSYMFQYCRSLESLNLMNFDTSNVTDMQYMFYECNNLASLNLSSFNTEKVVYMNYMFYYCIKLESINLLSFNTEKVYSMKYMFYNCRSLKSLDLSSFKTRNLYYIIYMVYSCPKLESLDISNFYLNGIDYYSDDYYYDSNNGRYFYSYKYSLNFLTNVISLKYLNLKNVEATRITDFNYYFSSLTNLISVDLSNFKAGSGIRMQYMFSGCQYLEYVHLPNFSDKTIYYMNYMFNNCKSLKSLDMSRINTRNPSTISSIFSGCNSLISLDISNFDLYNIGSFSFLNNIKNTLQYLNMTNVKTYTYNLSNTFLNFYSLISIDLTNIYISSATNLNNLFHNCFSLQSVDLSNLNTKNVINMSSLFYNCTNLKFVNLSNLNTDKVQYMDYMFNNCSSLTSIELTNLNTSSVISLEGMFNNCSSLNSIDLSNLDTSSVKNMEGMFYNCYNLEYVNIKNINTKSAENMDKMFYKCSNLKYINFYSINKNVQNITDIFSGSSENFTYCIKDETKIDSLFQELLSLNNTKRDCTSHCYNYDMIFIPEENRCVINCSTFQDRQFSFNYECYESCPKRSYLPDNKGFKCEDLICDLYYDYEQKKCIDEIPDGYFLNDTELKTIDMCHSDCKRCDKKESENSTNCRSCFEDKFLLYGNCVSHCESGFFIDKEYNDTKKCKCEDISCLECSEYSLSKNMCISCNENYSRIFNDSSDIEPYFKCYSEPQGYYFDKNDSFYKKCYPTCETCYDEGNETDHKCIECKPSVPFKFNNSCYKKCDYYFYFDEFNDYYCTRTKRCSNEFNKLIESQGRCVDDCKIDNTYKYEFQKICHEECPIYSKKSDKDEFRCVADCPEERPYEIIKTQECVENCSTTEILSYECIINNKKLPVNQNLKDDIVLGFLTQYLTGDYNTSNISLQDGVSFTSDNMRLEIINYEAQIISNKNETNIHLGECEKKLREYYHIPDNETLLIFKIEEFEEGLNMPLVQYKIFKGKGREILDLNICNGYKIDIIVPVSINEDELYKYNSTSDYYNSICFTYTSENGTDIPLEDRQNEFVKNNMTLCEKNCDLDEYDKRTKKAVCKCDINEDVDISNKKEFDMKTFYDNFISIKRVANLDVMKCYRNLFTKEGILKNYISFIIIPIILFHIISYIIFHLKDINQIRNTIRDIISFKKITESLKSKKKKRRNTMQNVEQFNNHKKRFSTKRQTAIVNNVLKKENENNDINEENKEKKEEKELNVSVNCPNNPNKKKAKNAKRINNYAISVLKTNGSNINKSSLKKIDSTERSLNLYKKDKPSPLNEINNIEIITNKKEAHIKYNDFEINNLEYEEALKIDKRNYFQYYYSLIRTRHILLFVFYSSDYNSIIIKLNLFFLSFVIYFFVNALFFDDKTMHKIYTSGGSYDFAYQIPKIVYSSLISTLINCILKSLSLSEMNILEIKNENNVNKLDSKVLKIEKCLCYKFMIFFRLSFVLLLFCWYYLSCFCVVYKNTQIQLIKDSLIGFSLCLIYPLGLYLIPGLFRIPSLRNSKRNKKALYNFSKLLQLM